LLFFFFPSLSHAQYTHRVPLSCSISANADHYWQSIGATAYLSSWFGVWTLVCRIEKSESIDNVSSFTAPSGFVYVGIENSLMTCTDPYYTTTGETYCRAGSSPTPELGTGYSASGFVTLVFNSPEPPTPPPCSQPTPIDFPLCKGGTGMYSFTSNAVFISDHLSSYGGKPPIGDPLSNGFIHYVYPGSLVSIYESYPRVSVEPGSTWERPDGSTCKMDVGITDGISKFIICPQGDADQPDDPSSSSPATSSSSGTGNNSSSSASDLCSVAPWLPWCSKSSASTTPSSASAGGGDDWCDLYPGSLLCEGYGSSNSGNDGGCEGPDCEPGDPNGGCTGPDCANGTEPGGGGGSSGSGGTGPGSGGNGPGGYPEGHCDGVLGFLREFFTDECGGNVSGDPGGYCDPTKEGDCDINIAGAGDTTWGVTRNQFDSALVAYGLDTASFKKGVDSLFKDTAFVFKSMRTAMEPFSACFGDAGSGSGILDFSFKTEVSGIECGDACRINLRNFMGVDVADILNVLITFLLSTAAAVRIIRVAKTLGQTG